MEQSYRVLAKKLSEHPLVKKVDSDYFHIHVTWKSGIHEKWVIIRKERTGRPAVEASIPPVFIPVSSWLEELSNGKSMVKTFKNGINEFEHDPEQHPASVKWAWSEYEKLGFFEQRLFVHEYLQFILDHGWINNQYSNDILNKSLQLVYDEPLKFYKYGRGWKLSHTYRSKEKPGHKLIDHFIPLARYSRNSYSEFLNKRTRFHITMLYKGIVNMIRYNNILIKRGDKPKFSFFDYDSLMANMRFQKEKPKAVKLRSISLYRSIIKEFGMVGKSMFDFDPMFGEKSIAAFAEECPYYYRPTCPFDMGADGLAEFLGTSFKKDVNDHYDFAIVDFNFRFRQDLFQIVMDSVYPKVDSLILFVDNYNIDRFKSQHKIVKSKPLRVSRFPMINGEIIQI